MGPIVREFDFSSGEEIKSTSVKGSMARMGMGSTISPRSQTTLTLPRGSSPQRHISIGHWNVSAGTGMGEDVVGKSFELTRMKYPRNRRNFPLENIVKVTRVDFYKKTNK